MLDLGRCPKNQNRCWNRIGSRHRPRFEEVAAEICGPVNRKHGGGHGQDAGSDQWKQEEGSLISTDQRRAASCADVLPGARMFGWSLMKFYAARSRCTRDMQRQDRQMPSAGPGCRPGRQRADRLVQPVPAPVTLGRAAARNIESRRQEEGEADRSQNERLYVHRGTHMSGRAVMIGTIQLGERRFQRRA